MSSTAEPFHPWLVAVLRRLETARTALLSESELEAAARSLVALAAAPREQAVTHALVMVRRFLDGHADAQARQLLALVIFAVGHERAAAMLGSPDLPVDRLRAFVREDSSARTLEKGFQKPAAGGVTLRRGGRPRT